MWFLAARQRYVYRKQSAVVSSEMLQKKIHRKVIGPLLTSRWCISTLPVHCLIVNQNGTFVFIKCDCVNNSYQILILMLGLLSTGWYIMSLC